MRRDIKKNMRGLKVFCEGEAALGQQAPEEAAGS
jgi:hypothetical protein